MAQALGTHQQGAGWVPVVVAAQLLTPAWLHARLVAEKAAALVVLPTWHSYLVTAVEVAILESAANAWAMPAVGLVVHTPVSLKWKAELVV